MTTGYSDITGIILVGGKSRRMGRDKAFLTIDGQPIVERILTVFRDNFAEVVLVGGPEERYATYGFPHVPDIYPGSSLGGLYSGLFRAGTEYVFVASCDLPYPNGDLLRYFCSLRAGYDAVVPVSASGYEPLFALYRKSCLGPMQSLLERGNFCAYGYFPDINVRYVPQHELAALDREGTAFVNINTPAQYAACCQGR